MSRTGREWTVLSMLEWATDYFKKHDVPDPRLSIEWLLAETLGIKRLDLYLNFDRPLSSDELDRLRPLVKRRARHEPLQYITGFTDFMHARIDVTPDVLIPRIETEQLVEEILGAHSQSHFSVLDIGTGSGCIAIALKMERPEWQVSAIDVSPEALSVARRNAEQNEVDDIVFSERNILEWENWDQQQTFDLIVSNPPYVQREEASELEPQVSKYEPGLALFGAGGDIKMIYQQIIEYAASHLKNSGYLYLEIHEHYAEQISALFDRSKWNVQVLSDYEKKQRFIAAQYQLSG